MARIPVIDINFPAARETELLEEMNHRSVLPWAPQGVDPHGRPREENRFYIHRDAVGDDSPSTICAYRKEPGHWQIVAVVPDEWFPNPPVEAYLRILSAFDSEIAGPAAETVEGLSAMGTSQYRLEDHFSQTAIKLLERFCKTSNMSDGGHHLSDQEKWVDFLLCAYAARGNWRFST
jgi:hypothetical protein